MRKFLFLILIISVVHSKDYDAIWPRYWGPQLHQGVFSEGGVSDNFIFPRLNYTVALDWYSVLNLYRCGDGCVNTQNLNDPNATYLRFMTRMDVSPLYIKGHAGLGVKFLPYLELMMVYSNMVYFGSNVELPLGGIHSGEQLDDVWSRKEIFARLYERKSIDVVQNFQFRYHFYRHSPSLLMDFIISHTLSDVKTALMNRSYDYSLNLPIARKDHILESTARLLMPLPRNNMKVLFAADYITTGFLKGMFKSYTDASIQLLSLRSGVLWYPDGLQGNHYWALVGGVRVRNVRIEISSLASKAFLQFLYQHHFRISLLD
jgi:hypothetical protein